LEINDRKYSLSRSNFEERLCAGGQEGVPHSSIVNRKSKIVNRFKRDEGLAKPVNLFVYLANI
jgi:hypothetical protein